jgi:DNA-binding transcriptional MerR regulator
VGTMTIGEFAVRTRLSPKALRLYDRLGLVRPAFVDPATGYRVYCDGQIGDARLVGLLRRIDMPLATIADVIAADQTTAAAMVADHWAAMTTEAAERRAVVAYLRARLTGAPPTMYDIQTRTIADREVLSINRHVHLDATPAFFDEAFPRLRAGGSGLAGIDGAPYLVFYGEVSADSDGPLELCRPVAPSTTPSAGDGEVGRRTEAAHDEVYIRLTRREMGWPAMVPAVDALEAWIDEHRREAAGPLRQVLIADQRTASDDTAVCDLTVPLR